MAQTELAQQMLKAKALCGLGAALGQVLVDDVHPCGGPAKRHRPLDQFILASGALGVMD
jgi:hypothetical protein